MKYELMYIISQDANDEQKEALIAKFSKMVEDKGGTVSYTHLTLPTIRLV